MDASETFALEAFLISLSNQAYWLALGQVDCERHGRR